MVDGASSSPHDIGARFANLQYLLDAWIWKFDGSNPGLEHYLFGDSGANPKV